MTKVSNRSARTSNFAKNNPPTEPCYGVRRGIGKKQNSEHDPKRSGYGIARALCRLLRLCRPCFCPLREKQISKAGAVRANDFGIIFRAFFACGALFHNPHGSCQNAWKSLPPTQNYPSAINRNNRARPRLRQCRAKVVSDIRVCIECAMRRSACRLRKAIPLPQRRFR